MFKRWFAIGLIVLGAMLASGLVVGRVTAEDGTPCRRLVGAPEWTRRCLPQRSGEDYASYCRRLYDADEWTRRCAPERPDEVWRRYCRRIWATSEWTRRCLNLLTPTATPTIRSPVVTAEPTRIRPTDVPPTGSVSEATPTPRGGRP